MFAQLPQFAKVYSSKKASAPDLVPIQGFDPSPGNKVTISNPSLQTETEKDSWGNSDLNLPIAIRKGTREQIYTKTLITETFFVVQGEKMQIAT